MKRNLKTNVMRLLDQHKIPYESFEYNPNAGLTGIEIAQVLNNNPKQVFKTLVTNSENNQNYVFIIPVEKELDLKKAAKAANTKRIRMIKSKDLLKTTGYIHGGCSPIGMKKSFPTFIDSSIKNFDNIIFSAGKVGFQVKVPVKDLKSIINFQIFDLT